METVRLPIRSVKLPPGRAVDVWLTDLNNLPLDPGPMDDGSRRVRVQRQRIRQQFIARLLLGAYLGCPGKAVKIVREARGKPRLGFAHVSEGLEFNLSHSGGWLAVAIGRDVPVGIDIETQRVLPRARLLARRFLSAPESEWLEDLDEPFLSHHFLRQWTAREALVKAMGCGLAGQLGKIELSFQPVRPRRLPEDWPPPSQWHLQSLRRIDELCWHLAVPGAVDQLRLFRLETGVV